MEVFALTNAEVIFRERVRAAPETMYGEDYPTVQDLLVKRFSRVLPPHTDRNEMVVRVVAEVSSGGLLDRSSAGVIR